MTEHDTGSPAEFATRLAAHLAACADPDVPLPSEGELRALIEATFFASLHEEEGRRVEFGVAWQPEASECAAVVAVGRVAVSPSNLAKLAPATWGDATSIAVRRDGGELVAWALLERNAYVKAPLTIRVIGAGALRVDYAGLTRALYARGEMLFQGSEHFIEQASLRLTRAFAEWSGRHGDADADLRAAVIARIAARALAHRHGGMILIVPHDSGVPEGVRVHYAVDEGSSLLVQRYERVLRDVAGPEQLARLIGSRARGFDGRIPVRDTDQIAFGEAIELVARLTAIDNALMLDTELHVRGFGVQVIASESAQMQFRHINPYTRDSHIDDITTFKGTRHPAGVVFCMQQPREAAAIIASQDGNLSLAVRDSSGQVEVVGPYVRAFGWR